MDPTYLAENGAERERLRSIEPSSEAFAPKQLGALLRSLIQNGPPSDPIVLTEYGVAG